MTTAVVSRSRRVMVLIAVIIVGVFLNVLTSEAKDNPYKKANKVYANACAKLNKKHGQSENVKVTMGKRPAWR